MPHREILSPLPGTFYRKPAPDAPPFANEGDVIKAGDVVGLVEVMKTFNQIAYGGPGFPEAAEVVEVRAGDAEEVQAGQVLVVVR
jgi:biotin carboxyl carrier protein